MGDFVDRSHVFLDCPATTRDEALALLSARAAELGLATDGDAVLSAFLEREQAGSTGMVGGFAIPHAKSRAIPAAAILVARFSAPLDWGGTQDGEPVRVAIALLVPEDGSTAHLRLLAQVATMIVRDSFRSDLLESGDAAHIAKVVSGGLDA